MSGKEWAREFLFRKDRVGPDGGVRGPGEGGDGAARLAAFLRELEIGATQQVGSLELVPLVAREASGEADLLLHEAIARGKIEIREREGGVVRELEAASRADVPILILEGETLVGCKQNRIVAVTILVPPRATVVVPVGCMERGRWSAGGPAFRCGAAKAGPPIRRENLRDVLHRRSVGIEDRLDQAQLWKTVACEMRQAGVRSPTDDYHELIGRRESSVRDRAASFIPMERQVGAVALWKDRLLGIELAGRPGTWAASAARAVPAFLMAADDADLRPESAPPPTGRTAREWLAALAAGEVTARPARGLGEDLAVRGDRIEAAGLWHDGRPVHLVAFER